MLHAFASTIEVRAEADGSHTIAGKFPYGSEAELARGRFERFASRSLRARPDVYLLAGHDFNKPLASAGAGSLSVTDDDTALTFEARIAQDVADTSHGKDALALIRSGLAVGLSPGFRVAPDGETVERRDNGVLRTVRNAELFELSIVTRPAYTMAQVEARSWQPENPTMFFLPAPCRWR